MSDVQIRQAAGDDLRAVAELRWRWVGEMGGQHGTADDYVAELIRWAADHADTHIAFIAHRDSVAIGMAWLALQPRVPSPGQSDRKNVEVQSVYVVPDARRLGVGQLLISAALAFGREVGAERALVQSSADALTLYARTGFAVNPHLLDRRL